jgi:uncharacterized membrane protein
MAVPRAKIFMYTVFGLLGLIAIVTLLTAIFSGFANVSSQWDGIKRIIGNVYWWWALAACMTNLGTFFFHNLPALVFGQNSWQESIFMEDGGWCFFDK